MTESSNAAECAVAVTYIESQERVATAFGEQLSPGSVVKMGPVVAQKNYTGFEVRVVSDGALVALVVTIAPGMPEADVWITWVWVLEDAGLQVRTDAAYEEICFQAAELEEQWVEENSEYFLACIKAGQWPKRR
jgi:hypothetical protein